ncbi:MULTISPECIES: PTS galactosamine/N-acetylgalactosamine transporter subunit IIA [Terrabacteria group]|uniref:PTS galactosamine/N-acetylgalactosamine transporter subunit IIA n=1 Tax=Bacillati TaxID=1783272 RepID=UPI001C6EA2AE|nr:MULTISPECIES: PTS galactosamine/N-acetylgalactosamine transporter subunit IIA [Terrabacteria group]MBW9213096.1 PTS sugar transporter subunit IIA [Trueperella sp. zg.1013]
MIGMIVSGHGHFATGVTSSVELIAGHPDFYVPVDFEQNHSTEDLKKNLENALEQLKDCEGVLILTDLLGGSPFKVAVELSMVHSEKEIRVLSGTNLGMIIEGNLVRQFAESVDALANQLVQTGHDQTMKYEFVEREEVEMEDGI